MIRCSLMAAAAGLALLAAGAARAQEVAPVTVLARDQAGLIERQPNDTALGLSKPLIETPRSATLVSDVTLERYGLTTIDDLTALSPGAYTASFYGVAGAPNIRGSLAETYFRGFKRVENRGTFATPLADAAQVEIVRGPPSPIYGPGKVGGMLNLIPKSARAEQGYPTALTGALGVTVGAYGQQGLTGEAAAPFLGGGLRAYGQLERGDDYYRGIRPERGIGQLSGAFDLPAGWGLALGGMIERAGGEVQTPGWNRLTQALIDHRTYITGRDTSLRDLNGDGKLTFDEISPGHAQPYAFNFNPLYLVYGGPVTDAAHTLDVGVGTTTLGRRTVYVGPSDFSKTETDTAHLDLTRSFATGSMALQLFHDDLENRRFVSYGFPAWYQANVEEARATWRWKTDLGVLKIDGLAGASWRTYRARRRESFNSGVIALDRRDLGFGPTPTDTIDDPFSVEACGCGLQWENDNHSRWRDGGAFFTLDVALGERFGLILGGRYDDYRVRADDTGALSFTVPGPQADGKGSGTYNASFSVKPVAGFTAYVTYAQSAALEVAQAGDILPGQIADGSWLSRSHLAEAGLKGRALDGALTGSLAVYRQDRTQLSSGPNPTIQGLRGKGVELELRYLVNERLSLTFAGDMQRSTVKGPDTSFAYIPAATAGATPAQGFGGAYLTFAFASLPGRGGDYDYSLIPHSVVSLYATYTEPARSWGRVGLTAGLTAASKTSQTVQGGLTYPASTVANASVWIASGPVTALLNVENLFDTLYFTPTADTYANLAALPSKGRLWRLTLRRAF